MFLRTQFNPPFLCCSHLHTTSAQKCFARLFSWSLVLAISCKDLFFLYTTPFCCGVLGEENSWMIPCFSQKISNGLFSNSPPWSLLTIKIFSYFSDWFWMQNLLNTSYESSLDLRNLTMLEQGCFTSHLLSFDNNKVLKIINWIC